MARYALRRRSFARSPSRLFAARPTAQPRTTVVATGIEAPGELVFLPDSAAFVTERPGRVVLFSPGFRSRRVVATLEVDTGGRKEGGLLGIALDPVVVARIDDGRMDAGRESQPERGPHRPEVPARGDRPDRDKKALDQGRHGDLDRQRLASPASRAGTGLSSARMTAPGIPTASDRPSRGQIGQK
jgi:hypothetical protein